MCSSFSLFSLMAQYLRFSFWTLNSFSISSLLFINRKWGCVSWILFCSLSARSNCSLLLIGHLWNLYLEHLIVIKVNQHHICFKLNLCLPVMMILLRLISKTPRFFLRTSIPKGWILLRLLVSIKILWEPFLLFFRTLISSHAELPSKSP